MQTKAKFPKPTPGASLILSFRLRSRKVVIIGSGQLAASRAFSCLETDAHVMILARGGLESACDEVKWRVKQKQIEWKGMEAEAQFWRNWSNRRPSNKPRDEDKDALDALLSKNTTVSLVCITDTIASSHSTLAPRSLISAKRLYKMASRKYGIPTNTTDMPSLCDFSFPATHRFRSLESNEPTALQISVLSNAKGCRLSSRIIREIIARLPKGIGSAVDNIGRLRDKAKADGRVPQMEESMATLSLGHVSHAHVDIAHEDEDENLPSTPNEPVPQVHVGSSAQDLDETSQSRIQRRMRWVAQVSEYWPLESLVSLDDEGMDGILSGTPTSIPRAIMIGESTYPSRGAILSAPARHTRPDITPHLQQPSNAPRGRILLLGSGPGHPSLLTLGTSYALRTADLVLSDKLVPEAVLQVIPKHVELRIARKFPGNADRAEDELMYDALDAAERGKVVVRLKQGDPMLYARASLEIEYLTARGFPPAVVPGLSSAFAAPLAAGIPITARGVAESVAICTGVAKGGKRGRIPSYERATTVLVLMSVASLAEIVRGMMEGTYPNYLPTCIIERGTMPDQRVVRSTLGGIVEAMSDWRVGVQRPPGMMVVGWACLGVAKDVEGVSDDAGEGLRDRDLQRVDRWLGGERLVIVEGLDESWQGL